MKNKVYYGLWSDYTESIITVLCDSVKKLEECLTEVDYDISVDDRIEDCKVCKVEMLEEYDICVKPSLRKI